MTTIHASSMAEHRLFPADAAPKRCYPHTQFMQAGKGNDVLHAPGEKSHVGSSPEIKRGYRYSTTKLVILPDGGGGKSASKHIFKEDLQNLSTEPGVEIRGAHFPPYCSQDNSIKHRCFPHVPRSCLGVPPDSFGTAQHPMATTETTTGLKTSVRLLETVYEVGRQYAADFKKR